MVAQFLRLKLQLLGNAFRRKPIQILGLVLALVYGLVLAIIAAAGLVALRTMHEDPASGIVVVFGSTVVLGFIFLPLVFGVDDTIDARRFSGYGIPNGRLAAGLALSALLSVPSLVIMIIAIAQIATWSRGILPLTLATIGAVLIVCTCVLGARVSTAIASFLLASRRARDTMGVLAVLALVLVTPLLALLATVNWERTGFRILEKLEGVLGWTPLGAVWSAPADAADGELDAAWAKLAIAAGFVALLWFAWRALIAKMLVTPQREAPVRVYEGLGWFARLAGTPSGAIAARSITYWGRDARYRTSLIIIPLIPIVPLAALAIAGVPLPALALIPLPVMALFLSWATLHNDVAFDDSALWVHLASSTRGLQDRWGRAVPVLLIGVPLIAIGSVVTGYAWGDWAWLPSILGFSSCVLFAGIGMSSVISARFPYPVVKPGDSPFAQPQTSGTPASRIQSLSLLAVVAISLPVAALTALAVVEDNPAWHLTALVGGLALGGGCMVGGIAWGARIFERRAPELLEFTLRN